MRHCIRRFLCLSLSVAFIAVVVLADIVQLTVAESSNQEQRGLLHGHAHRVRRTSSDQRLAELQALATLERSRSPVGHGRIDPAFYGKRKRFSSNRITYESDLLAPRQAAVATNEVEDRDELGFVASGDIDTKSRDIWDVFENYDNGE